MTQVVDVVTWVAGTGVVGVLLVHTIAVIRFERILSSLLEQVPSHCCACCPSTDVEDAEAPEAQGDDSADADDAPRYHQLGRSATLTVAALLEREGQGADSFVDAGAATGPLPKTLRWPPSPGRRSSP